MIVTMGHHVTISQAGASVSQASKDTHAYSHVQRGRLGPTAHKTVPV